MGRFVEGEDRAQQVLLPPSLEDYVGEDNPVRVVDAYIDELDLAALGFARVMPKATGRPAYHPSTLLKIYLYGYLNRIQSSRRLEREAGRNIELMWLTGRLAPDFKTIADFRKDNGPAIQAVCAQFIALCREIGLFAKAVAAIDGAKFKAVNARDRNFTRGKLKRQIEQVETSEALAWQTGVLQFRDVTLAEAVTELNRYSESKLRVDDPALAAEHLSGAFAAGDQDTFAETLKLYLSVEIRRRGNEILVEPAGGAPR
jgi:transposase